MRLTHALFPLLAVAIFVTGCAKDHREDRMDHGTMHHASMQDMKDMQAHHEKMWGKVTSAVAVLHPTANNKATGTVYFQEMQGKLHITAMITGLTPSTHHGFHIHEFGDCTAADGTSAGGHYNPEGHAHAGPMDATRHAGDLGNVMSDAQGNARLDLTVDNITIVGMTNPIIGRGLILHADADDLKSQPTGNAGGRIACGVIGVANPKTAAP